MQQEKIHDGNDTFVLDTVESMLVESPDPKRHRLKQRTLFGNRRYTNPLDVSEDPVVNELRVMREIVNSCPALWTYLDALCPEKKAIFDEHLCDNAV